MESNGVTGITGTAGFTASSQFVSFVPVVKPGKIFSADLAATIAPASGGGSLLRADAQVAWYPPRDAAEYISARAYRSVTVSRLRPGGGVVASRTFASARAVARLAALINGLPAAHDVATSCPGESGWGYRLAFNPAGSAPRILVYPSQCWYVSVTVGGRSERSLFSQSLYGMTRRLFRQSA
jgi:hypothetical protein